LFRTSDGEARFTARRIASFLGGRFYTAAGSTADPEITGFCVDSRRTRPGFLFFALPGETFDGFDFQEDARKLGAVCAVVKGERDPGREVLPPGDDWCVIEVEDPLEALHALAARFRSEMNPFTAAISGSNGKTTTKDLAASILSGIVPVLATPGNENSQVGVPLTILRLAHGHRVLVLETGMSKEGELARLGAVAEPDIVLLSNIGPAHLETLGSLDAVARAKFELIPERGAGKFVLLNADDPLLRNKAEEMSGTYDGKVITYGLERGEIRPEHIEMKPDGKFVLHTGLWGGLDVPLPGRHNGYNVLAAALIAHLLGATAAEIREGLRGAEISGMRMEECFAQGVRILNDAYNANPASVAAAIGTLGDMRTEGGRHFVLGEMLELGPGSGEMHRSVARAAARAGFDSILLVGACWNEHLGKEAASGPWSFFDTAAETVDFLSDRIHPGDIVLIKGSRGARLEDLAADLENRLSRNGKESGEESGDAG